MNWKNIFIPSGEQKAVISASCHYVVIWYSRHGEYSGNVTQEAKFFLNREDAELFATQLKAAFTLIKHSSGNNVELKQINN